MSYGNRELSYQKRQFNQEPVWVSFFHHSISITHRLSLIFSHSFGNITFIFITQFFHTIHGSHTCQPVQFVFFFFLSTQLTEANKKKKNQNRPNQKKKKKKNRTANPKKKKKKWSKVTAGTVCGFLMCI